MRIRSISVEGLFGTYNHTIDMSENAVSILLGDNGLGKTTIFRMLYAFFNRNYSELLMEEYRQMTIVFDNDTVISFAPEIADREKDLIITLKEEGKEEERISLNAFLPVTVRLNRLTRKQIESYFNEDGRRQSDYSLNEDLIVDSISDKIVEKLTLKEKTSLLIPRNLERIQDKCNVNFVKAQRILTPIEIKNKRYGTGNTVYRETLEIYSEELKEKINATKAIANDKATQIDGSFPVRLLDNLESDKGQTPVNIKDLKKKLSAIYDKQKAFSELNLIKYDIVKVKRLNKLNDINDSVGSIIETYISDMNEKLSQYETLFKKLRLFVDLANGYMINKRLEINYNGEMSISFSDKPNQPIPLNRLSSGEQNLLVLLYSLIFIAQENSIVLLDEPEISLHVVWQRRFIDDLLRIIEVNPLQICVATHSPSIISTHWNLTQEITNELDI